MTSREAVRIYWGCTTHGCDLGFSDNPSPDLPRVWKFCPECGGELTDITSTATGWERLVAGDDHGACAGSPTGQSLTNLEREWGDRYERTACLCEWRGDLRVGTHARCPIHGAA